MTTNSLRERVQAKVGAYWSQRHLPVSETGEVLRVRWWQSPFVLRNINKRVSGRRINGMSAGLVQWLKDRHADQLPLTRGVSVGCGNGLKEMALLRAGLVQTFELYELSEDRAEEGRRMAEQQGLAGRVRFHVADAFEANIPAGQFDIVHWNNALHHMFDMDDAVGWSKKMLRSGGVFYLDDFIGPDRFQWSDDMLRIATRARCALTSKYMANPVAPETQLSAWLVKPDEQQLISVDPSEAVQSSKILPAVKRHFPNVEVKHTGGVIYNMTLSDILHNFDESDENDVMVLKLLLMIDELSSELGHNHYAVALATKI